MRENHDIVIIGGGPAGLAAAVAAYDAGVTDVVIIDREEAPGGVLRQCIHNGFGLHKLGRELTGPEYAAVYAAEAEKRGICILRETMVTAVSPERVVTACSREGIVKIAAGAVILAMGCRERSRGALNIGGTRPAGIFSAGTAQRLINCEGYMVGKKAVILGSGDIGLIMARRLTLEGAKVEAVCELMPYSGGLMRNIVQCLEDFDIPLYLSTTVQEIHGRDRLTGVTVVSVDENRCPVPGTERYIECDTLLLSCGLIPENELTLGAGIALDGVTGGATVDERRETEIPGIFACGNVLQVHDLVDYVSDEAELAGRSAAAFVRGEVPQGEILPVSAGEGIRYCLPQRVHADAGKTDLYMRVAAPSERVKIVARSGGRVLLEANRRRVAPGEMEKITLTPEMLSGAEEICVSLEAWK